jgi:Flp pilus assembly protein protease CpaA
LTTTAHELGIALVLSVLTAVAVGRIGGGDLDPAGVTAAELASGLAVAFRAASAVALAAMVVALLGLRRDDVAPGTAPAVVGH